VQCAPRQPFRTASNEVRQQALLRCTEDGLSENPGDVKIQVVTPRVTPSTKSWYVIGIDAANDETVGWGEAADGFEIIQMERSEVMYAGIPSVSTVIAFTFETKEQIQAGGTLMVLTDKAPGFELTCDESFDQISLPGEVGCTLDGAGGAVIQLNDTLTPGAYAFAMSANTPPQRSTSGVYFSLILEDHNGLVRDAAMDLPGPQIQEGFVMRLEPLYWDSSTPGTVPYHHCDGTGPGPAGAAVAPCFLADRVSDGVLPRGAAHSRRRVRAPQPRQRPVAAGHAVAGFHAERSYPYRLRPGGAARPDLQVHFSCRGSQPNAG